MDDEAASNETPKSERQRRYMKPELIELTEKEGRQLWQLSGGPKVNGTK